MYWQLAWQSLSAAKAVSLTSAALVCVSVLCVVGAEQSLQRLAHVVGTLADGGVEYTANIDIARCPSCVRIRRGSPYLQRLVHEVRHTQVRVFDNATRQPRALVVPVHCLAASSVPRGVMWLGRRLATEWSDAAGTATVVVGADIASFGRSGGIRTSAGVWRIVGYARARPSLSTNADENGAILVPNRAPFMALCAKGSPMWRLSAHDSTTLHSRIAGTVAELRTATGMRPGTDTPWQVQRTDRFDAVVRKLIERFRAWMLLVPVAIALLCGAGLFGVQTLQSEQRTAEFGIRRAVGASRTALLGQLVAEALATGLMGAVTACLLLYATGLFAGTAVGAMESLLLAIVVAMPLMVVGLLIPGVAALRAASIAQLEGRGP